MEPSLSEFGGSNGFRLVDSSLSEYVGFVSVSGAGDVNGDGFDDLIIGASEQDTNVTYRSGASYGVFGFSTFVKGD